MLAAIGISGLLLSMIIWNIIDTRRGSRLRVQAGRVEIASVQQGEFQEYIPITGTVVPIVTHYIDAVRGGVVEEKFLEEGSFVEIGQNILRLSNTNLLLDIMYREAELYNQSNNLRNTKIAMEQNRLRMRRELLDVDHAIAGKRRLTSKLSQLARNGFVSKDDLEEAKEELEYLNEKRRLFIFTQKQDSLFRIEQIRQLEEALHRMQSNLGLVRLNLEELVVHAPVSGQLTALDAEVGQVKSSGERLAQIDVLDGYKVRAAVDEHYIARVSHGQIASLDLSGTKYRLVVDKVYPRVVSGRFDIDLSFESEVPQDLRRGRTLHLRLKLGDTALALLLPYGAFLRTTGGQWAYQLVNGGGVACKRNIAIGRRNPRYCEVLEGLAEGDRVIISSYEQFGDADRIILE
jgi:HlyD family secretion protein